VSEEVDFAALGLLDGLGGEERVGRERLLARLHADGVSIRDLEQATETGVVVLLGADRLVGGGSRYSVRQIAELSGLGLEFQLASMRASGQAIPPLDDVVLGPGDLELARIGKRYRELGLPDADSLEMTRLVARGLAPVAETMRKIAMKLALRPGVSEDELALEFARAAERLMPQTDPFLGEMMRLQLRTVTETEMINQAERQAGRLPGSRDVAVCFADLVGFTRVGEEIPADELGEIPGRLESLTLDMITRPVRFVKSIGDAVMLVSPNAGSLLHAALALIDAAGEQHSGLPDLRAGVATGPALSRAGDWFGRPVNLASRITGIARPGSVLAAESVRQALGNAKAAGGFRFSTAGHRELKGISQPVGLYRVRRAA
jgi:adenylate cyclase